MNTEKIKFDDGQWWEIHTVVTRSMRKRFNASGSKSVFNAMNQNGAELVDLEDPAAIRTLVLANPDLLDLDHIDDAFLVYGTHAWSFDREVSLTNIDQLDDKYTAKVLERMHELYIVTEEARKN